MYLLCTRPRSSINCYCTICNLSGGSPRAVTVGCCLMNGTVYSNNSTCGTKDDAIHTVTPHKQLSNNIITSNMVLLQ